MTWKECRERNEQDPEEDTVYSLERKEWQRPPGRVYVLHLIYLIVWYVFLLSFCWSKKEDTVRGNEHYPDTVASNIRFFLLLSSNHLVLALLDLENYNLEHKAKDSPM